MTSSASPEPPRHGRHGVLADDGERVQCHECGAWYRSLSSHLSRRHSMTTAQYKAAHGVPQSIGLTSAATRERFVTAAVTRDAAASLDGARGRKARGTKHAHPVAPIARAALDRNLAKARIRARETNTIQSDEQVVDMRERRARGESLRSIAERYDTTPKRVSGIWRGASRPAAGGPTSAST